MFNFNDIACKDVDTNLFFSELKSKIEKAKTICNSCPVKSECLEFALNDGIEFGIFGGATPQERKQLVSN
jgi:WhiB family transcriptional regulator, redox-sensing transcriptional regulator